MKLREYLKTIPSDTFVYLSSGECFFYIGQTPLKDLPKCDKVYKKYIEAAIKRNTAELRYAENRKKRYGAMKAKEQELVNSKFSTEFHYNAAVADLKRLPKTIERKKAKLKNWVNFLDREVVDTFPRRWIEPLGMIVKIKGREHGCYWSYDEWLKLPFFVGKTKVLDGE